MPLGKSVVWPRSHCPHCKKRIPGYDNIPFLSYIILGGRCRFCKQRISLRYLVVELLTAVMFVVVYNHYGLSYDFFIYTLFICGLLIATFVDIKHRIIPDEISVGGIIIGFILNAIKGVNLKPFALSFQPVLNSFLGIIVGGGLIYLTGWLFDLVYFKMLKKPPIQGETESMGGGDVKLLAMIGAFLGWQRALLTFFLAPLFGVVVGVINLIVKKDHTIPYGPFLSLGALLSLFWADKIINLILIR
jgi:leader peptidase (prepilin peptidase)/N-methyltransferase